MANNLNIADFKRNDVFIREIDASVRQIPAQTTLQNFVPGFSRKGPVNRPILVQTPQEFIEIFGDIDRNLEKKGCFFHRTVLNIMRNGPVWALNLLKTDDSLDTLEWKTVSVASDVINRAVIKSPYSKFFNRADFWYRDTDAFLNVAKDEEIDPRHIFHITNMSDKKISVFPFKSSSKGYDETLESWYNGKSNVPSYLHPTDYVSDYLISVLVVAGDWSDYKTLSVDSRWSKYFNVNGLRKDQITNFINDTAVTVLNFYSDLSIIPYFKDRNNRDLFVETVINRDTDRTGLFVAYNIDAVEGSDYSLGLLDLIGSNLVGTDTETIEYLSYKETITETVSFTTQVLDRAGNAFGYTGLQMEGNVYGTPFIGDVIGSGQTEITLSGITSYILGGVSITPDTTAATVNVPNVAIGKIRKDTLYLDSNGAVGVQAGFEVSNQTQWTDVPLKALSKGLLPIGIIYVGGQGTQGGLAVSATQIIGGLSVALDAGTNSADILISYTGINQVTFTFTGTKTSDVDSNYRKTKLMMVFNQLLSKVVQGSSIIKDSSNNKVVISNLIMVTDAAENKSMTINVAPSININNGATPKVYFVDDELTFTPTSGSISKGAKTDAATGYGVVSTGSSLYKAYRDGNVNSGDYFFPNLFNYSFANADFATVGGNSVITLYYNSGDIDFSKLVGEIRLFGTDGNDMKFTILSSSQTTGSYLSLYNRKAELIVNESVKTETAANASITVHGASVSDITYLKMFFINDKLTVTFTDSTLTATKDLDITGSGYNLDTIKVLSDRGNFKESLEIEAVLETNKILVNGSRYSEVKIGDFLQAYVDTNALQSGEVAKKLTRILNKKLYAADPTLVEITTDAQIDILAFGTDLQTFRYTTMEDYVNTYNAIVLGGFKMRADSMPDGTEARQSSILDLVAPGTPLFKGLTNRHKLSWRYLVDPWGLGLTGNSKQQLVDLCGERLTCLGFINMPSAKDFKNSTATLFLNDDDTLSTEFISKGGNPESSPAFLYSYGQGKGQSNVAYFFPYVTILDNGRNVNLPPASFVCNAFMRKHTTRLASVKPWTVVAGLNDGLLTGFGNVEIDLTSDDIENMNAMNANPIVYKANRGFCIDTDFTAQVLPKSALSYTHVREVLINLEEELYQMLLNYQWKFNTQAVRDEIKEKADGICERYVREEGLYDFFNVIDESNNTGEIIDAQMGILDTFVEPVKAMGIIVNNVTILKTGDIRTGGFRLQQ